MQLDRNKPALKPSGTKRLKLNYDEVLSNFAFNFNSRHYTMGGMGGMGMGMGMGGMGMGMQGGGMGGGMQVMGGGGGGGGYGMPVMGGGGGYGGYGMQVMGGGGPMAAGGGFGHGQGHGQMIGMAPTVAAGTECAFRLLCPGPRIGSVIGRGGDVIRQIRAETTAKIKILDAVPGAEERVVLITCNEDGVAPISPAQVALFRVYACVAEAGGGGGGGGGDGASGPAAFRMLVPAQQIGCLLGKGGSIIKGMRDETGAQIRILPRENLPLCALEGDELVEVGSSPALACSAAIRAVSTRLRTHQPKGGAAAAAAAAAGEAGAAAEAAGGRGRRGSGGEGGRGGPGPVGKSR